MAVLDFVGAAVRLRSGRSIGSEEKNRLTGGANIVETPLPGFGRGVSEGS